MKFAQCITLRTCMLIVRCSSFLRRIQAKLDLWSGWWLRVVHQTGKQPVLWPRFSSIRLESDARLQRSLGFTRDAARTTPTSPAIVPILTVWNFESVIHTTNTVGEKVHRKQLSFYPLYQTNHSNTTPSKCHTIQRFSSSDGILY